MTGKPPHDTEQGQDPNARDDSLFGPPGAEPDYAPPSPPPAPASPVARAPQRAAVPPEGGPDARFAPPVQDESFELALPPRAPAKPEELLPEQPEVKAAPHRSYVPKRLAFVVGALALVVAGALGWPHLQAQFPELRRAARRAQRQIAPAAPLRMELLRIDSEPSGATLFIAGREVGTTPFVADNLYPEGRVPFEIRLDGHETYQGTFEGGGPPQAIDAQLKRASKKKR